MKCFTPAIQNQHPIAVWIVSPYKFQLTIIISAEYNEVYGICYRTILSCFAVAILFNVFQSINPISIQIDDGSCSSSLWFLE